LQPFGSRLLVYEQNPDIRTKEYPGVTFVDLDELAARSDIISLHVPLNAQTYHLVDKSFLSSMKKSALLINTCRGAVVNESDLVAALSAGEIAGYAADVFEKEPLPADSPLCKLPNTLLTPHIASFTVDSLNNTVDMAVKMVTDFENHRFDGI